MVLKFMILNCHSITHQVSDISLSFYYWKAQESQYIQFRKKSLLTLFDTIQKQLEGGNLH